MSWGVGGSDVVAGIKLAWQLYNLGFVDDNKADVQYRNFRNDIQGFAQLLEQLETTLIGAHQRYTQRSLAVKATGTAYDPLALDFDTERCHFIGDFMQTLEECKSVLEQNKILYTNGSNIFKNIEWKIRNEGKVADLRKRIEFHSTKTLLVIDRLSLGLLTDIDAKVDDLLGLTEQNLQATYEIRELLHNFYNSWKGSTTGRPQVLNPDLEDRHIASPAIQSVFFQRAETHPDKKIRKLNFPKQIQLAGGFDTLLHHFEKCIDVVGRDQTPDHYLCLLKARWLVDNIKLSQEYEDSRPGFYYKRAIARIEQAIRVRVQSNAVIEFEDDVLLALPKNSFDIWHQPDQTSTLRHDPTMPRADEKEIIRLDLVSDDEQSQAKVTVLQRSHSHYRIVVENITDDHREFVDKIYIVTEDKLIPRYALPLLTTQNHEIAIFSRGEELLYRFHNMNDVYRFQKALMGYEVSHHVRGIKCGFSEESINCKGVIQIWQDPIDFNPSASSPTMPSLTLINSNSMNESTSNTRHSSVATSIATTTVSRVGNNFQAKPIAFPAISIFTMLSNGHGPARLALIYLKLGKDVRLFTEQCGCKDIATYDECPLLYIEHRKRSKFPVYVLYSDPDERTGQNDPNTWDLSPFRIPEHPEFKRLKKVETTYLVLWFPSLVKKREFHEELENRFLLRDAQMSEQKTFFERMRHEQDRPRRVTETIPQPQLHHRSASFASNSTTEAVEVKPLKPLDFGTNFSADFEKLHIIQSESRLDNDDIADKHFAPTATQFLQRPVTHQLPTKISTTPKQSSRNPLKRMLKTR